MWAHFCHSPSAISPKPRNINPCIDIYVYKAICRGYKLPMSLGTIYFTIPSSPETRRTRIYTKRPWTWTSEVGELKEGLKPRASRWGFMKFPVTDPHWESWYLPIHGMVGFFMYGKCMINIPYIISMYTWILWPLCLLTCYFCRFETFSWMTIWLYHFKRNKCVDFFELMVKQKLYT